MQNIIGVTAVLMYTYAGRFLWIEFGKAEKDSKTPPSVQNVS